jgi:hypothetical protein
MSDQKSEKSAFEEAAHSHKSNFLSEMLSFLSQNKRWWLTPIIVVLLLLGALIFLGGSAAAPFIYTLF